MNESTLFAMIALVAGVLVAYRLGMARGRRDRPVELPPSPGSSVAAEAVVPAPRAVTADDTSSPDPLQDERARLVRSCEAELASMRESLAASEADAGRLREFAADRRQLFGAIAEARAEAARYRQIIVDLENNAPPPLLDGPGSPDDLKLIVGVGPVLERMLQQLGIGRYRQIARWTERDIDHFDAQLAEFPGRIRRDAWVTQARELHLSKYGERL